MSLLKSLGRLRTKLSSSTPLVSCHLYCSYRLIRTRRPSGSNRFPPNSGEVEKEVMAHKQWRKITRGVQVCGAVTERELQRGNKVIGESTNLKTEKFELACDGK
ncbi:hypothetical protein VIGAN_03216600 [Vigna angularis var. angularis]|uniref:Uncharacterized protein n=1 Tax=Vigna angularis var. angularis TaxID=157739 RepID=A0A0S3RNL6_PHAAN|nr:hypothetical protein VIGAN_03216600 [Vigna angularis var. angularis]